MLGGHRIERGEDANPSVVEIFGRAGAARAFVGILLPPVFPGEKAAR